MSNCREKLEFEEHETPLRFPKLKKLIIDFYVVNIYEIIYIDFSHCSDSLESMEFDYFGDYIASSPRQEHEWDYFLESMKNLHNLKTLTLMQSHSNLPLLEPCQYFKNLRLKEFFFKSICT